ncbi:MAG: hypothetical protein K6T51_01550 [Rubrobacteraceae bacterium]|uniref:hypothetical protein n=1 Tax=Rubrobacter naiadicus TaxID=1392641 RepID=UPI00235F353F|nr:hypothetical protein [Rubrobacter naiadicus]MBX6764885.1 hypothetical protein [Rubrobacteraceae bacterium]MCL6437267.1 hypothetical protein [Rubrobacteraceae bacterium]
MVDREHNRIRVIALLSLALASLVLLATSCSGRGTARSSSPEATGSSFSAAHSSSAASSGGGGTQAESRTSGLSGIEVAGRAAERWHKDAKLYAVATARPDFGPDGRASAWLYSYVSPSSRAYASFLVRAKRVERVQQGRLSEGKVKDILKHVLPARSRLVDSTTAVKKANKVLAYLKEHPGAKATAGVDSFSTDGKPAWIFTAIKKRGAVEQKIPALKKSS